MSIVVIKSILERALEAMPGIIPSVAIQASNNGEFQTEADHGLVNGLVVEVSGHTGSVPDLNGVYYVAVTAANRFKLQHILTKTPIASTAPGVGGVIIAKLTAWEGVAFKPLAGVPMQRINLIWSKPQNPSYGDTTSVLTRESGFMQVSLYYPLGIGTRDVLTRAQLIKSTFPRGASFSSNGITVNIDGTAEIMGGVPIEEHYIVPVRIPFWADVYN